MKLRVVGYIRVGSEAQLDIVKKAKPFTPPVRRDISKPSEKIELLVRWRKPGSIAPKIWLLIAEPSNL